MGTRGKSMRLDSTLELGDGVSRRRKKSAPSPPGHPDAYTRTWGNEPGNAQYLKATPLHKSDRTMLESKKKELMTNLTATNKVLQQLKNEKKVWEQEQNVAKQEFPATQKTKMDKALKELKALEENSEEYKAKKAEFEVNRRMQFKGTEFKGRELYDTQKSHASSLEEQIAHTNIGWVGISVRNLCIPT